MHLHAFWRRWGLSLTRAATAVLAAVAVPALAAQAPPPALTLEQVLHGVLERHPLVEAAEALERAARGGRLTARLPMNPVLTYWVENARFPGQTPPPGMIQETALYGTMPLDPLWQRWSQARRAGNDVKAAGAGVHVAQHAAALDAARAFHRVALAQVAVAGARDIQEKLDGLVGLNEARLNEGVVAEGDLIRIQVERDRAATELALHQAEFARARGELFPFLDDATRSAFTVASLMVVPDDGAVGGSVTLPSLTELTAVGLQLRPDVVAARAREQAASAGVGYQRSLIVRQVGATFGTKSVGGIRSMIVGLTLPIPLFDQNVNVNWPLVHYKSAVRYLQQEEADIAATGGTNWQKYLPPRFQKRIFYPELWSEEEIADWGKSWVNKEVFKKD